MLLQSAAESRMDHVVVFTFDFEVVSSKTVGLEVEGQWRVGLIQEQVDPGQLNAVPLKHWSKNFSGNKQTKRPLIMIQTCVFCFFSSCGSSSSSPTSVFSFSSQVQFLCLCPR